MSKEIKKKDPVNIILDVVILIMIFVVIVNGVSFVFYRHIARKVSFTQEAEMMSFDLKNDNYASLIQGKYINEFNGDTKAAEYHALADYVEAASMYKVYAAKNYTDRAGRQKKIMHKARHEMGELTVFADKADEIFGSE